jgi:hypothetical protein
MSDYAIVVGLLIVSAIANVVLMLAWLAASDDAKMWERRYCNTENENIELRRMQHLYSKFQSAVDRLSAGLDSNLEN